ncbi:sporulation protein YabP [Thermoanaerobacter mathranii subsp. mathranii str. A3]|jgi:sporulation protein YabP|uniref:Sporulation protein YabP n=3 Tax=Thermoanaerobacter TaxID=1754 RepID=D3T5I0_THEIA|nr:MULTISPECIES: sporulation protein YabP [Thermoanaerobacter]ADD03353.1 sporulation protein YabP [Thermoanaerobacter italicus Ab9]ADH61730.1 sporulation protein YabP [Thermoanaerobacter mathranii subsp. mathranii str. A3]MBT1279767.1 sporulation protein YabP [Thermoanaerobacter sp. CM-CNRG TB177]MDP9751775.1 sporulation protein YabP [Thermoanaerobacter pentosaceus]
MEDKRNFSRTGKPHNITIENRERISISGVTNVVSFDEETVILETDLGVLTIRGQGLHINKLNLDDGQVSIDGEVVNLNYSDKSGLIGKSGGFIGRMFR